MHIFVKFSQDWVYMYITALCIFPYLSLINCATLSFRYIHTFCWVLYVWLCAQTDSCCCINLWNNNLKVSFVPQLTRHHKSNKSVALRCKSMLSWTKLTDIYEYVGVWATPKHTSLNIPLKLFEARGNPILCYEVKLLSSHWCNKEQQMIVWQQIYC